MKNQQLLDYIKQQLQLGASREMMKSALLANNWPEQEVEEGLNLAINPKLSSELPGVFELLKQSWAIYKQRFWVFSGVMAIAVILWSVGIVTLPVGVAFIVFISPFFVYICVLFGFLFWGLIALLYAIKDSQENIGILESYRRGWRVIPSFSWIMFLLAIITMSGFISLVVPGIIFAVWFVFAPFILICEDVKGINALLKSREYVKGNWLDVFLRILPITTLFSVISFYIFSFLGSYELFLWQIIIIFTVELALFLFLIIYIFSIYNHLKLSKGEFVFVPNTENRRILLYLIIFGLLIIPITWFYYNLFFHPFRSY